MTDRPTGVARRQVLKNGALGALLFQLPGGARLMLPSEARAEGVPFRTLSDGEVRTLEAFGEALLPGAREAGIAHYVDQQLSVDPAESFLMIRYLDVPPPWAPFYKAGLGALDAYAAAKSGGPFDRLSPDAAHALVGEIAQAPPAGWQGPPSPLIYFVMRSDAVDVVYGTEKGFAALDIPYMPHIAPPRPW